MPVSGLLGRAGRDESGLVAEGNRVHAIAQTKLREDIADACSHRGFAEKENPRDLNVRKPARDEFQDFDLTLG
jgi:hypothetical protein